MTGIHPGNIQYDIDAMRQGIEKKQENIAVLEKAIADEQQQIVEWRRIIWQLELDKQAQLTASQHGGSLTK